MTKTLTSYRGLCPIDSTDARVSEKGDGGAKDAGVRLNLAPVDGERTTGGEVI